MEIEVTIEKLAFGGDGIARVNGKVCFVNGVVPGEKVIVRVVTTQGQERSLSCRPAASKEFTAWKKIN